MAKDLNMKNQSYANHRRRVPGFHLGLTTLLTVGMILGAVNIFRHHPDGGGFISAVLIECMFVCGFLLFWYSRQFPLKAQDRAIRAEENLRYYVLTGKLLDARLTMAQTIALRFAPDEEFVALADKAVTEGMSPGDIKKAIVAWKADHHRV